MSRIQAYFPFPKALVIGEMGQVIHFARTWMSGIVNAAPIERRQSEQDTWRYVENQLMAIVFHQLPLLPTPLPYLGTLVHVTKPYGLHHSTKNTDPFDRGGECSIAAPISHSFPSEERFLPS